MVLHDPSCFRLRQATSDLRYVATTLSAAPIRRIAAGMGLRSNNSGDLQRRIEWYFRGQAPISSFPEDRPALAAVMMTSALPEEDFDAFLAATVLLLLERLRAGAGMDNRFWNWSLQSHHYRLAPTEVRAAIMCGFREAIRLGRINLGASPDAEDCLSLSREAVLGLLGAAVASGRKDDLTPSLLAAIRAEAAPVEAGRLWSAGHGRADALPPGSRRAALSGFRYLYERPVSMQVPAPYEAPSLPAPSY